MCDTDNMKSIENIYKNKSPKTIQDFIYLVKNQLDDDDCIEYATQYFNSQKQQTAGAFAKVSIFDKQYTTYVKVKVNS
jgi:hypothetical protein